MVHLFGICFLFLFVVPYLTKALAQTCPSAPCASNIDCGDGDKCSVNMCSTQGFCVRFGRTDVCQLNNECYEMGDQLNGMQCQVYNGEYQWMPSFNLADLQGYDEMLATIQELTTQVDMFGTELNATNDELQSLTTTNVILEQEIFSLNAQVGDQNLSAIIADLHRAEYNQAILAFRMTSSNELSKFHLADQVVDEYQDELGIDTANSVNAQLHGSGSQKYYDTVPSARVFEFTGANQEWTAPSGATSATIKLWGAGGGGGSTRTAGYPGRGGGSGGYIEATCTISPLTTYSILVGESKATVDGVSSHPYTNAYGGGGNGGGKNSQRVGGSGGGRTEFSIGGGSNVPAGTRLLVAAGGGGGNAVFYSDDASANGGNGAGGGGGGLEGLRGQGSSNPPHGGTQTAGGERGHSNGGGGTMAASGQAGIGGGAQGSDVAFDTDYGAGGGGGGGYYGGGGGLSSANGQMGQGGAGGSSYGDASLCTSVTTMAGNTGSGQSGGAAANTGDDDYAGQTSTGLNVGVGGVGVNTLHGAGAVGGHGFAVIHAAGGSAGMSLQSVAFLADSVPTVADLVVFVADMSGVAVINTDIKGYVSRDGEEWTNAVMFIEDVGEWGENKRMLIAQNIDLTGIASGTSMKYRITTQNVVLHIHATSLAWV